MPAGEEGALQSAVEAECDRLGLLRYHSPDSRRAGAGFPDLVIVGPAGLLWRELKSRDGRLKPEQRRWGSRLMKAGADWQVWRPAEWADGTITRQLWAVAGKR